MQLLKVITRNLVERTLVVECPHCAKPVKISPQNVTKLEDGVHVTGPCGDCHEQFEVSEAALGGYVLKPRST